MSSDQNPLDKVKYPALESLRLLTVAPRGNDGSGTRGRTLVSRVMAAQATAANPQSLAQQSWNEAKRSAELAAQAAALRATYDQLVALEPTDQPLRLGSDVPPFATPIASPPIIATPAPGRTNWEGTYDTTVDAIGSPSYGTSPGHSVLVARRAAHELEVSYAHLYRYLEARNEEASSAAMMVSGVSKAIKDLRSRLDHARGELTHAEHELERNRSLAIVTEREVIIRTLTPDVDPEDAYDAEYTEEIDSAEEAAMADPTGRRMEVVKLLRYDEAQTALQGMGFKYRGPSDQTENVLKELRDYAVILSADRDAAAQKIIKLQKSIEDAEDDGSKLELSVGSVTVGLKSTFMQSPLMSLLRPYYDNYRTLIAEEAFISEDEAEIIVLRLSSMSRMPESISVKSIIAGRSDFSKEGFTPIIMNLDVPSSRERLAMHNLIKMENMDVNIPDTFKDDNTLIEKIFTSEAAKRARHGGVEVSSQSLLPNSELISGTIKLEKKDTTTYKVIDRETLRSVILEAYVRDPEDSMILDDKMLNLLLLNKVARCGLDPEIWQREHALPIDGMVKHVLNYWVRKGYRALTADDLIGMYRPSRTYVQPVLDMDSALNRRLEQSKVQTILNARKQTKEEDTGKLAADLSVTESAQEEEAY